MSEDEKLHCDLCGKAVLGSRSDYRGSRVLCRACTEEVARAMGGGSDDPAASLSAVLRVVDWLVAVPAAFFLLMSGQYLYAFLTVVAMAHIHVILKAAETVLSAPPPRV